MSRYFRKLSRRDAGDDRQRGVTAVLVLVTIPVLIAMAALTIDVGAMYTTRAQLQNVADGAALAGASTYALDAMMEVRQGRAGSLSEVKTICMRRARHTAALNRTLAAGRTKIEPDDVTMGWINLLSGTEPIQPGALPADFNAVQVTVRRTRKASNGPLNLFFAPIFGQSTADITATAVAAYDNRAAGFTPAPNGAAALPFTIHEDAFQAQLDGGGDIFGYDRDSESIYRGSDGITEVNLYPHDEAPGNYGLLNIGTDNQSTTALQGQIEYGVSPEDLEAEVGVPELTFYDDDGNPRTYDITGNPGLKASLEKTLSERVGTIIAFFVHDGVRDSGSGVVYRIKAIKYGRLMAARLQTSYRRRGMWIQPVFYTGPGVIIDPDAPPSSDSAQLMIVR